MARLPLLGGSYSPRSIIANCQKCINLYPEKNAVAAPVPLTHYQRPGLRPLLAAPPVVAPVRALYRASNGNGYCVIGSGVYSVSQTFALTLLGNITVGRINPVSMQDNGSDMMIVDGSPNGWTVNMTNNAFAQITDPVFPGADRVDFIDTYLVFNIIGTPTFGSTLSSTLGTGPGGSIIFTTPTDTLLSFGGKSGYPDDTMTLIVNRREIVLIGSLKSEVWYDAGLAAFPFAALPGAYYEHGTMSRYSVAAMDISVFWLGRDLQGAGIVYRARGYNCTRISNHALEFQIRKMLKTVGIGDAVGYCYQQDGHAFYVLHFPAGDQTWVFDDALSADPEIAWHQEAWTDLDGQHHRHRGNCFAFLYGLSVVGDWQNGMLYEMDLDTYTDTVGGTVYPITRTRTFPHIGTGEVEMGQLGHRAVTADGHRVQFHQFIADIEVGLAPDFGPGEPPKLTLRYSDDRGRTWSSDVLQTGGAQGEYLTWPTWRGLGIARDRVFELEYSYNGEAALNGAWVEASVLES